MTPEDAIVAEFKRSGHFDALRKRVLQSFEASQEGAAFRDRLQSIAAAEVARDPSLLARDRGKAATLVGGVVERSDLYPNIKKSSWEDTFSQNELRETIHKTVKSIQAEQLAKADAATATDVEVSPLINTGSKSEKNQVVHNGQVKST